MKQKSSRLEAIKMIISSTEIGSQEELMGHLRKEGFELTQATLSRDLKQLKVAKASSMNGQYVYVLPNETMYKRVHKPLPVSEMMSMPQFMSIHFTGNLGVIRTRPGYASSIAYNIDNAQLPDILGTIAGDDTIFIAVREGADHDSVVEALNNIVII
jgi:transcriptional regulator of arginine metabolism